VTFNSEDVIGPCLDSLNKMAPNVKPVVVDNASNDQTAGRVRARANVTLIANSEIADLPPRLIKEFPPATMSFY